MDLEKAGHASLPCLVYNDDIMSSLSEGSECIDMVYLDFAKVFHKVDHGIFLHKVRIWLHSLFAKQK